MGGSIGRFFIGFVMFVGGLYLMLNSIRVDIGGMGGMFSGGKHALYQVGGYGVTSGSIIIVLMLGIGMLFFDARKPWGWLICTGAIVALIFGVIMNTHFSLQQMSAFDLIVIIVLLCGGLGLLLSSFIQRSI